MTDDTDPGRSQPDPYTQWFNQQQPAPGPSNPTPPPGYQPPQGPPQPPYGQRPRPAYRPGPPRKRHVLRNILLGAGICVVLIIVIAAVAGGGKSPSSSTPPASSGSSPASQQTTSPAAPAALATTGADGDFNFTVTSWSCGQAASDEVYGSADGLASQPTGTTECVAMLSVTNVHNSEQDYFQTNQYAINSAGQKLSADNNTLYASGALGQDDVQVNPGQTVSVGVAYAVPDGQTIAKLELHDSAFSGGVDVAP